MQSNENEYHSVSLAEAVTILRENPHTTVLTLQELEDGLDLAGSIMDDLCAFVDALKGAAALHTLDIGALCDLAFVWGEKGPKLLMAIAELPALQTLRVPVAYLPVAWEGRDMEGMLSDGEAAVYILKHVAGLRELTIEFSDESDDVDCYVEILEASAECPHLRKLEMRGRKDFSSPEFEDIDEPRMCRRVLAAVKNTPVEVLTVPSLLSCGEIAAVLDGAGRNPNLQQLGFSAIEEERLVYSTSTKYFSINFASIVAQCYLTNSNLRAIDFECDFLPQKRKDDTDVLSLDEYKNLRDSLDKLIAACKHYTWVNEAPIQIFSDKKTTKQVLFEYSKFDEGLCKLTGGNFLEIFLLPRLHVNFSSTLKLFKK